MKIFEKAKDLIDYRNSISGTVGFVPTMGALHNGHSSLIQTSKSQNDFTIVSIYVNPTQFLAGEDFGKYPRTLDSDIEICNKLGVDVIFCPNNLYNNYEIEIEANKKGYILEGLARVGHFNGVLRVVNKLFNIVRPNRAYFGKKDAQQLYMIQKMVYDFFMSIDIIPCEIIREECGLAMSSRNRYLKSFDKPSKIYSSLIIAKSIIDNNNLEIELIKDAMQEELEGIEIDYISFVDREFNMIERVIPNNTIILIAVRIDNTRLIDNIYI